MTCLCLYRREILRKVNMLSIERIKIYGFTLVEMLMALLIISIILSASLPVITKRMAHQAQQYNRYSGMPVGGIIIWGSEKPLPDNTWLECNGQAIPNGIEYEEIRRIYGTNLPDYRGVFLRGYGSRVHTQNNGSTIGNTATTHTSGEIGVVQGDTIRNAGGNVLPGSWIAHAGVSQPTGVFSGIITNPNAVLAAFSDKNITYHNANYYTTYNTLQFELSYVTPTSNEIRPLNTAVRYIIKVCN